MRVRVAIGVCQGLRERGIDTAIVALTANSFEEDRHACLAAGMDDFLTKPLSPTALRAVLHLWTCAPRTLRVAPPSEGLALRRDAS